MFDFEQLLELEPVVFEVPLDELTVSPLSTRYGGILVLDTKPLRLCVSLDCFFVETHSTFICASPGKCFN